MVGFRKPRKPRPKKTGVPKGYDSLWEVKLHETFLKIGNIIGNCMIILLNINMSQTLLK